MLFLPTREGEEPKKSDNDKFKNVGFHPNSPLLNRWTAQTKGWRHLLLEAKLEH
jgi:hypothetical protein